MQCVRLGLILLMATSCSSNPPGPAMPPPRPPSVAPPQPTLADAPQTRATIVGSQGRRELVLEVVTTPAAIERGLMYREHLAPNAGMWFDMGRTAEQTFWMRNTLIPLDMLFIDEHYTIVGIVERATPQTDTLRTIGKPSRYVLEVNGGYCAANGIAAGQKVLMTAPEK